MSLISYLFLPHYCERSEQTRERKRTPRNKHLSNNETTHPDTQHLQNPGIFSLEPTPATRPQVGPFLPVIDAHGRDGTAVRVLARPLTPVVLARQRLGATDSLLEVEVVVKGARALVVVQERQVFLAGAAYIG